MKTRLRSILTFLLPGVFPSTSRSEVTLNQSSNFFPVFFTPYFRFRLSNAVSNGKEDEAVQPSQAREVRSVFVARWSRQQAQHVWGSWEYVCTFNAFPQKYRTRVWEMMRTCGAVCCSDWLDHDERVLRQPTRQTLWKKRKPSHWLDHRVLHARPPQASQRCWRHTTNSWKTWKVE